MSKSITLEQITLAAKDLNIAVAALRAVMQVECRGKGFYSNDVPVILFERHVFLKRLIANNKKDIATKARKERPDLCNITPGGYGASSKQPSRLEAAASYDRTSALEAASWGIGQVMGYHWKDLGYDSLQEFINDMYKDESSQLKAMCRFIKNNKLDKFLRNEDWENFALHYNGAGYAKNHYDIKLEAAFKEFNN